MVITRPVNSAQADGPQAVLHPQPDINPDDSLETLWQTGHQSTRDEGQHPEAQGVRDLIREAAPEDQTQKQYDGRLAVLQAYCASQSPPWDPWDFSLDLAYAFAAFMLKKRYRGNRIMKVDGYFSAFNAAYRNRSLGEPWKGPDIARLKAAFGKLQLKADSGGPQGKMRTAVPASVIEVIVHRAEQLKPRGLANEAQRQTKAWYAIFLLMFLRGFRSDTVAGIDGTKDIRQIISRVCVTVTRLKKRDTSRLQPVVVETPMGPTAQHPRSRALRIILDAAPEIGPGLFGDNPTQVSRMISQKMTELLGDAIGTALPENCFCSSHSFRKAGASTLAAMQLNLFTIKKWGMWKTVTSPERYVDPEYSASQFVIQMMDHLTPYMGSGQTHEPEPVIEWVGEASDDDDAEHSIPNDLSNLVLNITL